MNVLRFTLVSSFLVTGALLQAAPAATNVDQQVSIRVQTMNKPVEKAAVFWLFHPENDITLKEGVGYGVALTDAKGIVMLPKAHKAVYTLAVIAAGFKCKDLWDQKIISEKEVALQPLLPGTKTAWLSFPSVAPVVPVAPPIFGGSRFEFRMGNTLHSDRKGHATTITANSPDVRLGLKEQQIDQNEISIEEGSYFWVKRANQIAKCMVSGGGYTAIAFEYTVQEVGKK